MIDRLSEGVTRVLNPVYAAGWTRDVILRGMFDKPFAIKLITEAAVEARHRGRITLWERVAVDVLGGSRELNNAIADFKGVKK